ERPFVRRVVTWPLWQWSCTRVSSVTLRISKTPGFVTTRRSRMKFFRHEVEVALRMMGVLTLIGLIVLPIAWGYEQRRQARTWQNVACAYRIKEVARTMSIVTSMERAPDACTALERLGFDLAVETE